jgi:hypothetical protein
LLEDPCIIAADHKRNNIVKSLNLDTVIVPIRNPVDSISSWAFYKKSSNVDKEISIWMGYHLFILQNIKNLTLLDFDLFTKESDYIYDKISIAPLRTADNAEVFSAMEACNKDKNHLPINDYKKEKFKNEFKKKVRSSNSFDKMISLYEKIKIY